jgi:hypothetical protein
MVDPEAIQDHLFELFPNISWYLEQNSINIFHYGFKTL